MGMSRKTRKVGLLFHLFQMFLFLFQSSTAIDSITSIQSLTDGETLVSAGENFELGFFSPGNSKNRYVGIWYHKIPTQTVVWVANRENPVTDSSGIMKIDEKGNIVVLDGRQSVLWSSNSPASLKNMTATLFDSSNFVLREANSADYDKVWQSFDHPTDSFLPTMKLGVNLKTGEKLSLTSWKSEDDPAPGNISLAIEQQRLPQLFLYNGRRRIWRSGQWNGRVFMGIPGMSALYLDGFNVVIDEQEGSMYATFSISVSSIALKLMLDWSGRFNETVWLEQTTEWATSWSNSQNYCNVYRVCGPFGICNSLHTPSCKCLQGFEPKNRGEWSRGNWTEGCVRRGVLKCMRNNSDGDDGFMKLKKVKLPDFADRFGFTDLKECENVCLKNCSCVAFANVIGIGCMIWSGELMDIQEFPTDGADLYLRLSGFGKKKDIMRVLIIIISIILGIIFLSSFTYMLCKWVEKQRGNKKIIQELFDVGAIEESFSDESKPILHRDGMKRAKGPELILFDFAKLAIATNNFSDTNKLGEGGFGPVYKGKLQEGQEIAVKRLSRMSGQGMGEFKNEVILISKLQHRNLVKLLGCCIEGEEKMLLYEFLPNKSLDAFLFDPTKGAVLDWEMRFHIIEGVARGLLYLHRDSRLRIIHRDLKASNILLDEEMNPKISDFGMAKIFRGDQTLANTNRVVGTYGYMAPEYAMLGRFSEKSDVYSFGVLLLEIVSGRKNTSFYGNEHFRNLLGYAWKLWNEGSVSELIDPSMRDSCSLSRVSRCIHVGLLCVQESERERPAMSSVVLMLGDAASLPTPKQPAYGIEKTKLPLNLNNEISSTNDLTITMIGGR